MKRYGMVTHIDELEREGEEKCIIYTPALQEMENKN